MRPAIITTGEPAGIGPDIALRVASQGESVVLCGDLLFLQERARLLRLAVELKEYQGNPNCFGKGQIFVRSYPLAQQVIPGTLNKANSPYVIGHILDAASAVLGNEFSALVTCPVHKAIINQAGIPFSGHTELLQEHFGKEQVVMMLAGPRLKVALVTNHLPLSAVPSAISTEKIKRVLRVLREGLIRDFNLKNPRIYVCGLNPHAGEEGILGDEETTKISPAVASFADKNVYGPFPADTLFTPPFIKKADAFLAMYHDQGLAVLKALEFGRSVNITLGLPIKRLSVDHGTALDLAGTKRASTSSLCYALALAGGQRAFGYHLKAS